MEKRVKNGSEVFLVAILVTTAILDVFEVLGIIFKGVVALASKFCKVVLKKKKKSILEEEMASKDAEKGGSKLDKFVSDKVEAHLEARLNEIEKRLKKASKPAESPKEHESRSRKDKESRKDKDSRGDKKSKRRD